MNTDASEVQQLYWNIFETAPDGMLITDLETGAVLAANPAAVRMHGYTREAFGELRLQQLIHAKSTPLFTDFSRRIQQGDLFEALAHHTCRDGSPLSVEWRAVAIPYRGRTCALALLRDVSQRSRAEFQDRQRAEVRAHEQTVLLEISQTLASTLELQPGLILDHLRVLIPYTRAGLFTLEDSTLVARSVRGAEPIDKSAPFHIRLSGKEGLPALFNGHRPIRIANLSGDEPPAKILRTLWEDDSAALLEGAQSMMWVPLRVKNRMIGGIGIVHAERDFFTPHHADLALTIANQAALTLVNAELYEHAQALAALQERQRLAQNLHDAVNQSLFSAGLIAEVLPRLWERDPDEARRSLEDLRRLTRGALAEMRGLLAELRPSTLTDSSLGDLLRQLANAFTGRTNIPTSVTVAGEPVLSPEVQVVFYRICQEALNNIAKHAGASRVEIEVCSGTGGLELHIRDNGRGFVASDVAPAGHYGLVMMCERADAVGAALTVASRPGEGTEITLRCQEAPRQETP